MDEEIYKLCTYPGIMKGLYLISNFGNILNVKTDKKKNIIKLDQDGYQRGTFVSENSNPMYIYIHRLVAWEFVKGYDKVKQCVFVNHKDSKRNHNYYENLEWVTHTENCVHGITHGNIKPPPLPIMRGEDNPTSVYSEDLVRDICELLEQKMKIMKIMSVYGYKRLQDNTKFYDLIRLVRDKKTWKHVSKDYVF